MPNSRVAAVEGRLDHVVEREIGLDRGVVEIGAALPQLLGVVAPVPRREREIAALLRDQRLQGVAVGQRPRPRRLPDPLQQAAHRLRRLGHGILQPVGGEGRIAQQLRASPRAARRISTMVALLSLALPLSPRAVKALNTFSRRSRRVELFRNGSTEERDSVTIALPAMPRSSAAALAAATKLSGQAGAVVLAELHEPVLLVAEQMVAERGAELRPAAR